MSIRPPHHMMEEWENGRMPRNGHSNPPPLSVQWCSSSYEQLDKNYSNSVKSSRHRMVEDSSLRRTYEREKTDITRKSKKRRNVFFKVQEASHLRHAICLGKQPFDDGINPRTTSTKSLDRGRVQTADTSDWAFLPYHLHREFGSW